MSLITNWATENLHNIPNIPSALLRWSFQGAEIQNKAKNQTDMHKHSIVEQKMKPNKSEKT